MSCSPRAVWMLGNLRCCEQRWVPISAFVFPSLDWDDIQNQLPKSVTVQVADNCSSYEREIAENMEANQSNKPSKAGDFGWVSSRPNCKDMHYEEYQSDSKLSLPRAETKLYHEGWAWEHRPCDWWRDSWTESGSRTIG